MKSSYKVISFNIENRYAENIFGFKIFSNNQAKQYIKAIKLLEQNGNDFTIGNQTFQYSLQLFTVQSITNNDIKILSKVFDLDMDDNDSSTMGVFPDAINDAYQNDLFEQTDEQYDQQLDQDEI